MSHHTVGLYPGQPVTHGRRCKENISVLDVRCSFCAGSLVEQRWVVGGIRAGGPEFGPQM